MTARSDCPAPAPFAAPAASPGAAPDRVPRLMLVTSGARARGPLPALVRAAVAGGVDTVQLRAPSLTPAARAALARELLAITAAGGARLVINGDLALARTMGVGAHLPEAGPDPDLARERLGPGAILGRSVHRPAAAPAANPGVDYLLAGHVYPTASHPGQPPLGLAGLRAIVASTSRPVLAIGGVTAATAAATLAAGARGLAVIGAITDAADPAAAAATLRQIIDRHLAAGPDAKESPMSETVPLTTIDVTINGKPVAVPAGGTITSFITSKGFTAEMVIVELNGTIIPRPAYPATPIQAGDILEIVHAVGGGSA